MNYLAHSMITLELEEILKKIEITEGMEIRKIGEVTEVAEVAKTEKKYKDDGKSMLYGKILYGNFAGDFYKGKLENMKIPEQIKDGIMLHRIIDSVTDRRENYLNELLKEYGLFKGIVSDIVIDHFLSKNFFRIFTENISEIEEKILYNVKSNKKYFPNQFEFTLNWLNNEKVMSRYSDLNFLKRVFIGMSQRVKRGEILVTAVDTLKKDYKNFEELSIKEFHYVKNESIKKFLEYKK